MLINQASPGQWSDDWCSNLRPFVCRGDACPNDPNKTDPGQCGCGVPDTDTDGDGTADCVDGCPTDAGKTAAGVCGCGVADTDSDGDGTPDCNEACPHDHNRTAPGQCGCVGETNLRPAGTPCVDGLCSANDECDGQGSCGSPQECAPLPGCVVKVFDDHAYAFCPMDRSWQNARSACQGNPEMDLVHIGRAPEDSFVWQQLPAPAWIGANDMATEGKWIWADDGTQFWQGKANGSAVGGAYKNWESGQSDDLFGQQDCAIHRNVSNVWRDENCGLLYDFVCEAKDLCLNDPNKYRPGQCGCGHPDTDTDHDGTADCIDQCPNNAPKTAPGVCGCAISDADGDGDGTADCHDECPMDAANIVAGDCGCASSPKPSGAACDDGRCAANTQCDGAGSCGVASQCGVPDGHCTFGKRGGVSYWFCNDERSFADARQRCKNMNMDLATVATRGEDDFITGHVGEHSFLGGTDQSTEGTWKWIATGKTFFSGNQNGSAVGGAYTNWESGQPSDLLSSFDCMVKDPPIGNGQWEAVSCTTSEAYVCKSTCSDGAQNGDETDVDCGGSCGGCPNGGSCNVTSDCIGLCIQGFCTTCQDGIVNGDETDLDCGGTCPGCRSGGRCSVSADCKLGVCAQGACTTCGDGLKNGDEGDIDCGGACPLCGLGKSCVHDRQCQSGRCLDGECSAVACGNVLGIESEFASSMWGVCPTRLRTSTWSVSRTPPTAVNWAFATGSSIASSAAVRFDGSVYVGSADDRLYALDGETGEELWHFTTGGDVDSSPAVGIDGSVVFGSDDGKVYRVRRDGAEAWHFNTGFAVDSSPLIGPDSRIYIGSDSDSLYALDWTTGQQLWARNLGGDVDSSPALSLDAQTLYVGSASGKLWAIRTADGSVKWSFQTGGAVNSTPAIATDGSVVFGSDDHNVYRIIDNGSNAVELWRFTTGGPVQSSAAIIPRGDALIGSNDGRLYRLQMPAEVPAAERARWSVQTGGAIRSAPVATGDNHVLFSSDDHFLRLVDSTGALAWSFDLGTSSRSSPVITPRGTAIVGTDSGSLVSVGVSPLALQELTVSGDVTLAQPTAILTASVNVTDLLPSGPECAGCVPRLRAVFLISQPDTALALRELTTEVPLTVLGPQVLQAQWNGTLSDFETFAFDGNYRFDVHVQIIKPLIPGGVYFPWSGVDTLGTTRGTGPLRFKIARLCRTADCTLRSATETQPMCELIKNTDLGWPTRDSRVPGATRFIFGDSGTQRKDESGAFNGFNVKVNGIELPISDKYGASWSAGGVISFHRHDDVLATTVNLQPPAAQDPQVTCGFPLGFPTDPEGPDMGKILPQRVDSSWVPGQTPRNGMGPAMTVGPAFSVANKLFAVYPNPDDPGGSSFLTGAQRLTNTVACDPANAVDSCITVYTPDDRCVPRDASDGGVREVPARPGTCMIGPLGSCSQANPQTCVPRWRGARLVVSQTAPQDWQSAQVDTDVVSDEVLKAFAGETVTDGLGNVLSAGSPFSLSTFLVQSYQGHEGVWVYGRPQYGGRQGHPSADLYLMRIDVQDGKLGEPRYFTGCNGGGMNACSAPDATPNLYSRDQLLDGKVRPTPLFNDEHVVFNQGAVSRLADAGGHGIDRYAMIYGGRPPIFVIDYDGTAFPENAEIPAFDAAAFTSNRAGIQLRVAATPWGPWGPAHLVYSALSPKWPGYCDLLYYAEDNLRAQFSDVVFGAIPGRGFPIAPPAPETAFCGNRFRERGLPFADGASQNKGLRFQGAFETIPVPLTPSPFGPTEFEHGLEYGAGIVDDLTRVDSLTGQVSLYWTMSTFVPYRVLLMRTLLQFDPGPDYLLVRRPVQRDRLDYNQILDGIVRIKDPLYALPACASSFDCCVRPGCFCPTVLCPPGP